MVVAGTPVRCTTAAVLYSGVSEASDTARMPPTVPSEAAVSPICIAVVQTLRKAEPVGGELQRDVHQVGTGPRGDCFPAEWVVRCL